MATSKLFKQFVESIRGAASNKGKPFKLGDSALSLLFHAPCYICNASDHHRSNRNVALMIFSKGYLEGNTMPVCAMCQKVRHGMNKTQLVSLAARTTLTCPLLGKAVGTNARKYRTMAHEAIKGMRHSSHPSVRAHSTNYNTYICSARKRCMIASGTRCPSAVFTLTRNQFNQLRARHCYYCGLHNANGIDRVYPAIGYTPRNSVPCCKTCNYAKNDLHPATYISHMANIVRENAG